MSVIRFLTFTIEKSLKPCPFCHGTDLNFRLIHEDGKEFKLSANANMSDNLFEEVRCVICGCNMRRKLGVGVVNQWNERKNIK